MAVCSKRHCGFGCDRCAITSTVDMVFTSLHQTQRGVGVKAAKQAAKTEAVDAAAYQKIATATAKLAAASGKRARALEDANKLALFSTRLELLDDDAREIYTLRRKSALQEMRKQMQSLAREEKNKNTPDDEQNVEIIVEEALI